MPISGIEVRLPPGLRLYSSQKLMMVRIIMALTKKLNLLAESPTGSGKTLALLASSCAWLDDYKRRRYEARKACPIHGGSGSDTPTTNSEVYDDDVSDAVVKVEAAGEVFRPKAHNHVTTACHMTMSFFTDFGSSSHVQRDLNASTLANTPTVKSEQRKVCLCLPRTRVYYGTRTHKQISQVVREFSRLPYRGIIRSAMTFS
ncbi:hypothetical protein KIN20_021564 [Parelaphostrongylus tenuis]|uniref:Helicase ATP-binding domain-containing protein n=1 Tax=Parelaphostrongylus tenuis TaxID=148309 RepID=A0AAD5MP31_PARTN|nr:hypothetical protein KIN20_021564 [Parelaphostrongylus tenuis]